MFLLRWAPKSVMIKIQKFTTHIRPSIAHGFMDMAATDSSGKYVHPKPRTLFKYLIKYNQNLKINKT